MNTATMNRGREANSPKEIPSTGWKDTLYRVKDEIKHDKLSMISAAMAYYALFAFVPALTAVVLIYAWVSDPAEIAGHIKSIASFIPKDMQDMMNSQLGALSSKASSTLGFGAISSLLIALWSASKGSKAIMDALNIIYEEDDKRGFIRQNLLALGMTLLAAMLSILAIGVIVGVPAAAKLLHLPDSMEILLTTSSWLILLTLFSFFLAFAYRFGPSREKAKWKWVSWGAVIAAVLWAIASALFSWYATKFGNFNKTYGSLGAVIVLMTWFYVSSFVILIGGEINAELEHQTKKDTTEGQPKPLGGRGAKMADTVGAAKA